MIDFYWQLAYLCLLAGAVYFSYRRGYSDGAHMGVMGTFLALQNENIISIREVSEKVKERALDNSKKIDEKALDKIKK